MKNKNFKILLSLALIITVVASALTFCFVTIDTENSGISFQKVYAENVGGTDETKKELPDTSISGHDKLKAAKEDAIDKIDKLYNSRGEDARKDKKLSDIIEGKKAEINEAKDIESVNALVVKTTELAEAYYENKIGWNGKRVLKSLEYMGIGMLCIFVVIGIIILAITILNKATSKKVEDKGKEDN